MPAPAANNNTNNAGAAGGNGDRPDMNKTKAVQAQVSEVVGIMQNNIEKVMERGEKMETLAAKTEDLQNSSNQFKRGATKVRKAMWWKDLKLKLMIAAVVVIILLIIIIPIVNNINAVAGGAKPNTSSTTQATTTTTTSSAAPRPT
ncbi:Vesicle membrane receptor protein (v-SNARE) [Blastocladiella emersonii ATCC 22665]|nr:Vesicle membrane receptor protein (v-SNARE) [Blastocladiella emersonii ATCC 22665]